MDSFYFLTKLKSHCQNRKQNLDRQDIGEAYRDPGVYYALRWAKLYIIFPYIDPGGEKYLRFGKAKGRDKDTSIPYYLTGGDVLRI